MTQKEQTRLQVLNSVLADQVPVCQAAEVLGVSERHMRRILAAYRKEGAAALAPRESWPPTGQHHDGDQDDLRGAAGPHSLPWNEPYASDRVVDGTGGDRPEPIYGAPHPGQRRHGQPPPARPRHRVRRKRMAQEGMLLQIDGSHHRWLGEQGPRFVLLLAVDDATGTVPDALFSQEEDTPRLLPSHGGVTAPSSTATPRGFT